MQVELILDVKVELGEGPIWDQSRQRLLFVDIMRGDVHEFDPATGADSVFEVGAPVGAVTPTVRGDWLVATRDGFFRLNPATGNTTLAAIVEDDHPDNRMNDGYCDPRGRFWAGTMSMKHEAEAGALYRLDPNGKVTCMLTRVTTSNGIDWSPDGRSLYYVDTGTARIDVFDFDLDAGMISHRRPLVTIPDRDGKPDGIVVDAEGFLWLALWGGSAIRRYAPDGRLDRTIAMPVTHPTKCAFGGADLSDLYITSAWRALSPEERAAQPHAGSLFHCRPGVKGRPALFRERWHVQRATRAAIARERAAQVPRLAKMERCVPTAVQHEQTGAHARPAHLDWILRVPALAGDSGQRALDDRNRRADLGSDLRPGTRTAAELGGPITDVPRVSEHRTDEMLEVAGDVQRQTGRGVRDSGQRPPDALVVRKQIDLALEGPQLTDHQARDIRRARVHLRPGVT